MIRRSALCLFCICVVLVGCKVKKSKIDVTAHNNNFEKVTTFKKFEKIQKGIKEEFTTLLINSDVQYTGRGMKQKVHVELKIKKDEIIHITVRFFGITMARALLTPEKVQYYEKLNSSYYQGDYTSISNWMGVPLDFYKIQKIIMGKSIDKWTKNEYEFSRVNDKIVLSQKESLSINHIFEYNISDMLLKSQQIAQIDKERSMDISYADRLYKIDSTIILVPQKVHIIAEQKNIEYRIKLKHSSVKLNKKLSYPYKVPKGYKQVELK